MAVYADLPSRVEVLPEQPVPRRFALIIVSESTAKIYDGNCDRRCKEVADVCCR